MNRRLMEMAEKYIIQRKRRMQLLRAVTAMALVVAICTSYVLILPGLTLAAEVYCGQEEHVHTADCYVDTLSCLIEPREATTVVTEVANCSFVPHQHTADCRNAADELCCGYWDKYIHVHDEMCYDNSGAFICTLKETPMHNHNDGCYTWVDAIACGLEENAGHAHGEGCYTRAAEPTCGLEESAGHHHDENCTVVTKNLTCDVPATQTDITHEHTDECYEIVTTYTCDLTEGEGAHAHTLDCYPMSAEPTCGLNEGDGAHTHTEECNAKVRDELTCTKYPEKVHTHSAACVDQTTGYYTCGYVEVLKHQHTQDCVKTVVAEDAGHQHTAACYTTTCVCEIPEHIHNDDCFIEKTEGEETAEPTPEVTPEATIAPTEEVTEEPTVEPTVEVTEEPTVEPTEEVTEEPTAEPTVEVTEEPTVEPTVEVTEEPTAEPTVEPTEEVTEEPTAEPTVEPTPEVTEAPTAEPTVQPTATPEGTDYTEEEWEYINAILNGTAPEGMGDIGFFGLDDPAVYAEPRASGNDFWDEIYEIDPNTGSFKWPSQDAYCKEKCQDLTIVSFDFKEENGQPGNAVYNNGQYNYTLQMDFDISAYWISQHTDEKSAWTCTLENFNPIVQEESFEITGYDENWPDNDKTPAYTAKYEYDKDSQTWQMKIWFTQTYRDYIEDTYLHKMNFSGMEIYTMDSKPDNLSHGNLKMNGKVTKDDIKEKESEEGKIEVGVKGDEGHKVTIKPDGTSDSITNNVTVEKNGGTLNLQTGTLDYTVKVTTDTGMVTSFTLKDSVEVTSDETGEPIKLKGVEITSIKFGEKFNINQSVTYVENSAPVTMDGTCTCGTTGFHIHYTISGTDVTYQIPPMEAGKELAINYQYTLDNQELLGSKLTSKANNKIEADNNGGSAWDKTHKEVSIETNITAEKQLKKNSGYKGDGNVQWTLTLNSNYVNIADKTLTDSMLASLVDAENNLIFDSANEDGHMVSIKATQKDGTEVNITAENYKNYFDVTVGEDGVAKLTFKDKDTLGVLAESKFEIKYQTHHNQIENDYQVKNEARFDEETVYKTETIKTLGSFTATKTSTTTALEPDENGKSTLTWSSTYQFPTSGKYALEFSDQISIAYDTLNHERHYYTKAQMEAMIEQLSDIIDLYEEPSSGAEYELYVYAYITENKWTHLIETLYKTNGKGATSSLADDTKYYGFVFKTTKGEVQLTTDEADGLYKLKMDYSSTAEFSEDRKNSEYARNTAKNKNGETTATYEATTTEEEKRIEKSFSSPNNGQLASTDTEIVWQINLYSAGEPHDTVELEDTLPPHMKLIQVRYGNGAIFERQPDGTFKLLNVNEWETNTSGEGYQVSYSDGSSWLKMEVSADTEAHKETFKLYLKKKDENLPLWKGTEGTTTITVVCKLDDDALESATLNNGTYTWDAVTNTVTGKFDDSLVGNTAKTETNFTYTDLSKQYKELTKEFVKLENNSEYAPMIKYSLDVNQGAELLIPSGSQLTLTDTMSYDATGSSDNKSYFRKLTLDTKDIVVYQAVVDENGKPELDKNGKLTKGTKLSRDKWSAKVEYTTVNNKPNVVLTIEVPDGMALIVEYEAQMTITSDYPLGSLNNIYPELSNKAKLTGASSYESSNIKVNKKIESANSANITSSYILSVQKSDADKGNVLLEGTEFELYKWEDGAFAKVEDLNLVADSYGKINFNYISDQREDLRPNTAYYLVETKAVAPYELPAIAERPLLVFHVLAKTVDKDKYPEQYPNNLTRDAFSALSGEALKSLFAGLGIQGVPQGVQSVDGSGSLVISMTNSRARRNITVEKAWANMPENPEYPDSVTVTLKRAAVPQTVYDAALVNDKIPAETWKGWQSTYLDTTYSDSQQMVAAGNWKMEFTKLEATGVDADGNALVYVYFVEEEALDHFTVTYDAPELGGDYTTSETLKLTNTYVPEMKSGYITIALTKAWEGFDDDAIPDSVQVRLVKQEWTLKDVGEGYGPATWEKANVSYGEWQTVYKANNWKLNITDVLTYQLVKNNEDIWTGTAYTYTIEEKDTKNKYSVSGLTSNPSDYFLYGIEPKVDNNTGEPIAPVDVTLTNFKLGIIVEKKWEDGIEASDTARPQTVNIYLKRYAVPEADYNNLQFAGNYATLDEAKWAILRNSEWQDTSYSQLIALNSTTEWHAGVYGLEATGKDTAGNTVYYIYYVDEELTYDRVVPGGENHVYTPSYDYNGSISNGTGKITITVTNTLQEVRKMSFGLQKNWQDVPNDKMPSSVTMHLKQQEWSYDATTSTWKETGKPVVKETIILTSENNWTHSFANLVTVEVEKANGPYNAGTAIKAFTYEVVEETNGAFVVSTENRLPKDPSGYFEKGEAPSFGWENYVFQLENYKAPEFENAAITITNSLPDTFDVRLKKQWKNYDNSSSDARPLDWPLKNDGSGEKVTVTFTIYQEYKVGDEWIPMKDEQGNDVVVRYGGTGQESNSLTLSSNDDEVTFEKLPKKVCVNGNWYDCRYKLVETGVDGTAPDLTWRSNFLPANVWEFVTQVGQVGIVDPTKLITTVPNYNLVTVTNVLQPTFDFTLAKYWENTKPGVDWPSQVETVTFELIQQYKMTVDGEVTWVTNPNFADKGKKTVSLNRDNRSYTFTELARKVFVEGAWRECRYQLTEVTLNAGNDFGWHVEFYRDSINRNWGVDSTEGEPSVTITPPEGSYATDPEAEFRIFVYNVLPDAFALSFEKMWHDKDNNSISWPNGLEITLTLTQQYNTNTGVQNPETGEPLEADWVTNTKDGVPVTWTLTLDESASSKRIDGLPKQVYINGKLCDCRYILTENEGQVTGGTQWELSVSGSNGNAIESCVRSGQSYVLTPNANTGTSSSLVLTNTIKFFAGKIELDITKEWSGVEEENIPNTLELRFFYRNAKFDASTEPKKWILEENEGYDSLTLTKDANGKWQGTLNEDIFNLAYGEDNNPTAGSYLKVYTGVIKEFDEQGNELTGFMPIYTLPSGMPTSLDDYLENEKSYTLKPGFLNNYKLTEFPKDNAPSEYYYLLSLTKPTAEGASDKSLTITNTPDKFTITKKWDSNFRGGEVLDMYLYLEYVEDDATGNNVTYQPVIESADSPAPKVSFTDVKGQTKTLLQGKNDELVSELFVENGKVYVHIKRKVETPPEEGPIEWKITFSGLPKNAKYRVTEMEGKGYTVAYSGSNNGLFVDVGDTSGNATITNTPTSIKVVKQFVTVDAPKTPINVPVTTLYFTVMRQKYEADGETKIGTLETYMDISTAQLKATAQNTTVSVNDDKVVCLQIEADAITSAGFELSYLPKYWYDASNQTNGLWKYTVQEVTPVGNAYQPVHAALDKSDVNPETSIAGDNTITVTNVVTDINVTKVWLAVDGNTLNPANLPDITLTLMQSKYNAPLNVEGAQQAHKDDVVIGTVTLSYDTDKVVAKNVNNGTAIGTVGQQTQTADKNIYWSYKWSNLPAYQQDGEPYYYYVKETNPGAGWTQATDATANTQNPIAGNATSNREFQITNEAIRYTLPETGGMGTLPYTAGGLLLMAAAAFLLGQQVKHRREDC